VHRNLAPCIISVSLVMAVIRGYSALTLFRQSARSTQRKTMQLFGVFLCGMGLVSLRLVWNTSVHGLPNGTTEISAEQAMMRATGLFYMATAGLFFLVLTSRELISRRRSEVHRDMLTGAFNRGGLELNLSVEMERSSRSGQAFSIVLVEVDQLGRILEQEGQGGGNATLREVAEAIGGQLRGTDHVGRFSGDLFLLVLSQTAQQEALIVAERISKATGKLKLLTGSEPITLSVGITESAMHETGAQMIARAEQALAAAKAEGRNCSRVVLAARVESVGGADSTVSAVA
jgi:diguanylate cyclase (GGDEF)-like protein